jgi:hypothetical protein
VGENGNDVADANEADEAEASEAPGNGADD